MHSHLAHTCFILKGCALLYKAHDIVEYESIFPMPGHLSYPVITITGNAGPVAEQVLLLENIGTSVLVGPEQLPSLHRLLITAANTLQMAPPDLYIKQV